jgi:uncharacterized protein YjbI with pentapeptide repeats
MHLRPDPGANLRGANLFRAKLSGADLTGADVAGADFSEADLSGTVLRDVNGLSEAKGLERGEFRQGRALTGRRLEGYVRRPRRAPRLRRSARRRRQTGAPVRLG